MGFLKRLGKFGKKAVKFEVSHTKNLIKGLKDDPKRLFLGVDPFSTAVWNKALGRDDRALVNQLGGATSYDYQVALDEGIDIGPGQALHTVAGAVAGAYAGGALGEVAGAGVGAVTGPVAPATQTAITAGTQMAVPAATAALEDTLEEEEEEEEGVGLGGLGGLRVYNVPTYRRAKGGYASPAQARLMRATAHGWKKPGGGGPSRAVAQEFVDAKDRNMYSGGFAENRYWTGGLAAMNEINSGVPQTLNFQEGGSVWGEDPIAIDLKNFKSIMSMGPLKAEGWQWDEATSTMYPPLWNIEQGGLEQTIEAQTTAPAPTTYSGGDATLYPGGGFDWGGYGNYTDWVQGQINNPPEPEPAPVRDIPGAGTLEPITGGTGTGGSTGGQWTPEQIAAWEAEQTASDRQSSYRDELREHKARIAATLNPVAQQISTGYSTGGRAMEKPKGYQFGGSFTLSDAQREALRARYQQPQATPTTATTNPTPEELHEWWLVNPGVPYPGSGQVAADSAPVTMTSANSAPATTGIGTPYVGYGGAWGIPPGGYTPPATTAAPADPVEMINLPGRDSIPMGEEVDMSVYKSSGIAGILKGLTEKALAEKGYYEGANSIWYPPESTIAGDSGTRDIPGAAGTSTNIWSGIGGGGGIAGAVFGAAKQVLGQGKWTPEQIKTWEAQQTAKERESPYRDRLREHKGRVADALKPGPMPSTKVGTQPPVYGDAPEPGMAYAGGVPGWYSPGGPGYGGQLSGGGYGYEGDPSQPGYDDSSYEEFAAQQRITAPDITDEVLKARYEGRNANQGVIYTSGIGAAKGGYMNYQEGGAARPTPVEGGGAAIPGHPEGTNPYDMATHPSSYRMWERKYHYEPAPPPEPEPPPEDPSWWQGLFGSGEAEAVKTRTQRELDALGEARGGYMRGYRGGGPVRRFQGGGLAMAAPVGGIPPWPEPEYEEPQGYQFGGSAIGRTAQMMQNRRPTQSRTFGRTPSRAGMMGQAAQQAQRGLGRAGGASRWTPQQQTAWRGARGNPALRSAMGQQHQQRQALMNRAPQQLPPAQAGRAGMMADAQRQQQALQQRVGTRRAQADYQAAQRGLQPGGGGTRDFLFEGQRPQQQSLADRLGGNRFGEDMRFATGRQSYQDVVNRGGGGINPRLPGGGRMYGSAPQPGMAYAGGTPGFYGPGGPGRGPSIGGGGGIMGGARVPPNMRGFLQKQRMMNRPPSNVGGGVNRVGQQDQQGGLSRAMQRGTGRRPMSRRGGFPGGGMR